MSRDNAAGRRAIEASTRTIRGIVCEPDGSGRANRREVRPARRSSAGLRTGQSRMARPRPAPNSSTRRSKPCREVDRLPAGSCASGEEILSRQNGAPSSEQEDQCRNQDQQWVCHHPAREGPPRTRARGRCVRTGRGCNGAGHDHDRSESRRRARTAGSSVRAAGAAKRTTSDPGNADRAQEHEREQRQPESPIKTVNPEKKTALPAVAIVVDGGGHVAGPTTPVPRGSGW